MKIGALVVYVGADTNGYKKVVAWFLAKGYVFPKVDEIYTVRGRYKSDGWEYIFLEEIVNPLINGKEFGYCSFFFREVQPPMDLTELLEETQILKLQNA